MPSSLSGQNSALPKAINSFFVQRQATPQRHPRQQWETQIKEASKTKEALRQMYQIYLSLSTLGSLSCTFSCE